MDKLIKFYKNKKIFITGHTGFKGSWLTSTLISFGAKVCGYSLKDEKLKMYKKICNSSKVINMYGDILDFKKLNNSLIKFRPSIIFHLAAQSIVSDSYINPVKTFKTNFSGTLNILEISKNLPSLRSLIIVTSDKCYENINKNNNYKKEGDKLNGDDPYSASKASAEILFNAYRKSFFVKNSRLGTATVRAGNVIGGGDMSKDRLIPDCIKSLKNKKYLTIRNPLAIRPWQHVLDVTNGYLILGKYLYDMPKKNSGSWNFAPNKKSYNVKKIVNLLFKSLRKRKKIKIKPSNFKEKFNLIVNAEKARKNLKWKSKLSIQNGIKLTSLWYLEFLNKKNTIKFTSSQINNFFDIK